jgi:tRNA (guanosine-2'-O-)-methyltransferase
MDNTQKLHYLNYLESFITTNRRENFLRILQQRSKHFTVAIQDIYQLHNTSAVLRTCEVFGVQELNVIEEKMGKTIDKEIALGAQKWVDVNRFASTAHCLDKLRKSGYRIIATTPHEDSCFLEDFDVNQPFALFFGTEINGLTDEVLKQADGFLKIPMLGFTESLNISSSAAIIIQSLSSKLRKSAISWQLTDDEVLEKRIDWTEKSIRDIDFVKSRYLPEVTV